jgi:hypothetical protein
MTEYIAAVCQMAGTEFVPLESLNITASNDEDAVQKALKRQTGTIATIPFDQRTWLQVTKDGKGIFSKEFGKI